MTTSDHGQALDRILQLAVFLNEDAARDLATYGLTLARTRVLWELQHRGPATQRTLAEAIGVSPRNITGLVDALVETGFVRRQPHPRDRRAALVTPTWRGTATIEDLARRRGELAAALFADMPAERFACLLEGLDAVLARLAELQARQ